MDTPSATSNKINRDTTAFPRTGINDSALSESARLDVVSLRERFPILSRKVYNRRLAYLDSAATTQKPRSVIDRISKYYEEENSNVHRGIHHLSQVATDEFEGARAAVATYLNADSPSEIIFTKGTTESFNLLASTLGQRLNQADRILVTELEHHANIVPWQLLCGRSGTTLDVVPIKDTGELDIDAFAVLLEKKPKIVSFVHTSNSLGIRNEVRQMTDMAHSAGAIVIVDGAQATAHERVDVRKLNCDFFCFSAHKMFGPTGIGGLYGKKELLESLPPYQGGGDMIETVSFSGTTFAELPNRLEAGTPNISGAIGFGAAIRFLESLDFNEVAIHESQLLNQCTDGLNNIGGVTIFGTAPNKASVVSFNIDGVHPYDTGSILDQLGVAVRTGHHCTMPLMERLGLPGTVRASIALYNNSEDIDQFIDAVTKAKGMLI